MRRADESAVPAIADAIAHLLGEKENVLVAIDGRCAAGKTTLAEALKEVCPAQILHMDDYFLRPVQRTPERRMEPGGNVDYERFQAEVLQPLSEGKPFWYQPFDCRAMCLGEPVLLTPQKVTITEGAYSCHPRLWEYYDLHVFLTIDSKEQMRRICRRNGEENAAVFRDRWIPLEECYFSEFAVEERCKLRFSGRT